MTQNANVILLRTHAREKESLRQCDKHLSSSKALFFTFPRTKALFMYPFLEETRQNSYVVNNERFFVKCVFFSSTVAKDSKREEKEGKKIKIGVI